MPLGILEDKYLQHVPGTALLDDNATIEIEISRLKKGSGQSSHVVLVPQPSDDPRDPLNWPQWKKECIFWLLSLGAGLVGGIGHLLNTGFVILSKEWGVSVNTVAATNNTLILALGCIMIIATPLAVKYGRRPVYILAVLLLFFCLIWSAVSQGIDSFTASRVFQGFGEAPFEVLVTATIGDIYFVHQRGMRAAIWSFAIMAGVYIAPIVNGYVIESRLGWRFCFWFISIVFGILMLGIFFLVPETTYNREKRFETDRGASITNLAAGSPIDHEKSEIAQSDKTFTDEHEQAPGQHFLPRKTILQELPPWSGYTNEDSFIKIFLRPFPFLLSPIVWFGIFTYGLTLVWLVILSIITATVFALPPYHFTASQVGLVSIGPFVGSIFAAVISGSLCDWCTVEFARRNRGIYEPESRLLLLFPMLFLEVFGYMGWALMAGRGVHWMGPVMMYTIINVGQSIGITGAVAYIIDVHRKNAAECFTLISLVKNVILYGFARFANGWVSNMGVLRTFGILAGLSAISILTAVPMYIYGKRARSFVARNPRLFLV